MEDKIRNLQEDIILQNCFISVFKDFTKEPDKPFYKFFRKFLRTEYSTTAVAIRDSVLINLLKEIMVIANQIWNNNPAKFDERLIIEKNVYNVVKSKISKDGKHLPFNTRELYKRIRQAISHNTEANNNFVYNLHNFELNLGKVDGEDYIINLEVSELYDLFYVLFANIQNIANHQISYQHAEIHSRQDVKEHIQIKKGEEVLTLDDNQVERVYNFFVMLKNKSTVENGDILKYAVAIPENPEILLAEKLKAFRLICAIGSNSTYNQVLSVNESLKNPALCVSVYYAFVGNLLFDIASNQTNEEIEEMLSGCIEGLTTQKVRHFRNALNHGRYFCDLYKNFYFYDGKKELSLKLKLSVQEINKVLDKIASGKFAVKTFAK